MSAFAKLMEQAKAKGCTMLGFSCDLMPNADPATLWRASALPSGSQAHGRTGEEALRKLVEAMP